jgi:deoxyribonuclease-1
LDIAGYKGCAFKSDASLRRAEPPDAVKGDSACAMLYMSETYRFNLSNQDRQLFTAWTGTARARPARRYAIPDQA